MLRRDDYSTMAKLATIFKAFIEGHSCEQINALCKECPLPKFFSYKIPASVTDCDCGFWLEHIRINPLSSNEVRSGLLGAIERGHCLHVEQDDPAIRAGITPLHVAVAAGHTHLVKWCLEEAKLSPAIPSLLEERTALHVAAGSVVDASVVCEIVAMILADSVGDDFRAVIDATDRRGETPLHYALRNNRVELVRLLISRGCNVNVSTKNRETPINIACSNTDLIECLKLLIDAGANVNTADYQGRLLRFPLHIAIRNGNLKAVEMLVDAGANLNYSLRGEHILINAIMNDYDNHVEAVKMLLAKGADPNVRASEQQTALMVAMYVNDEITDALLAAGAEVNAVNDKQYSVLHFAAWDGLMALCVKLAEANARLDDQTFDKNTPLSLACHGDSYDVANFLIGRGCNVNNADKDNDTPLLYAAFNGNLQLVNRLLESGADAFAKNVVGATAVWNAAYKGHDDVVLRLIRENVPLDVPSRGIDQTAPQQLPLYCYEDPVSPLQAALDQQHVHIGKLLVAGGANLSELRYSWFRLDRVPQVLLDNNSAREWFLNRLTNPSSLLAICGLYVRSVLGRRLSTRIHELELPRTLEAVLIRGVIDT